jgi:hypothetical protein
MPKFGPTGDFPHGKMNEDDEGGLQIGIAADEAGRVIIKFDTPVAWIGLERQNAVEFATKILTKAGAKKVTVKF